MAQYTFTFMLNSSVISMLDPDWSLSIAAFSVLHLFVKYVPYYRKFDRTFINTVKHLTAQMKLTDDLSNKQLNHELYNVNRKILENFESNTVVELNEEFLSSLQKTLMFSNLQKDTFNLKVDHFVFNEGKEPELFIVFELDKSRL